MVKLAKREGKKKKKGKKEKTALAVCSMLIVRNIRFYWCLQADSIITLTFEHRNVIRSNLRIFTRIFSALNRQKNIKRVFSLGQKNNILITKKDCNVCIFFSVSAIEIKILMNFDYYLIYFQWIRIWWYVSRVCKLNDCISHFSQSSFDHEL